MTRSPFVVSDQAGPHDNLLRQVEKHRHAASQKPVAPHTQDAFDHIQSWLAAHGLDPTSGDRLILDNGCGRGDSSFLLAEQHPDALVLGVDKSAYRLHKEVDRSSLPSTIRDRVLLVRADLIDLYALAFRADWRLARHTIFYPNPWPKAVHLGRRWHAAPVFPQMIALGGALELRTNWPIYAEEFGLALKAYGVESACTALDGATSQSAVSLHESKYRSSGHPLVRLVAQL